MVSSGGRGLGESGQRLRLLIRVGDLRGEYLGALVVSSGGRGLGESGQRPRLLVRVGDLRGEYLGVAG